MIRNLAAWAVDILLGPRCPHCPHRARGWRTAANHQDQHHPGAHP